MGLQHSSSVWCCCLLPFYSCDMLLNVFYEPLLLKSQCLVVMLHEQSPSPGTSTVLLVPQKVTTLSAHLPISDVGADGERKLLQAAPEDVRQRQVRQRAVTLRDVAHLRDAQQSSS